MVEVDSRGLSCPIPVIRVKDAIDQNPGEKIQVLIEDQETYENVTRLAEGLGLNVEPLDGGNGLVLSPAQGKPDA